MRLGTTSLLLTAFVLVAFSSGCKVRSDARLAQVEYRPAGGGAIEEWTFHYDDEGYLVKVAKDSDNNPVYERRYAYREGVLDSIKTEIDGYDVFEIEYEYDNNRLTRSTWSTSGGYTEGDLIVLTYSYDSTSVTDFKYGDDGRIETIQSDDESQTTIVTDLGFLGTTTSVTALDVETESSFSYTDRGTLDGIDSDQTSTQVHTVDGNEEDRVSESHNYGKEFGYADDGRLDQIEYDNDGAKSEVRFRYDQDGKVIEAENEVGDATKEYDVEYDDDGRVERIEDDAGNKWLFDYDQGSVRALTFGLFDPLPGGEYFDLKGLDFPNPVMPNVMSATP